MNTLIPESVHSDARRTITQLVTADLKQINVYHAKKGAILGGHHHKRTVEYFYIIKGTVSYNGQRLLDDGSLFVVYPEETHRLECLTDVELMTFLTRPYEDGDIWKA